MQDEQIVWLRARKMEDCHIMWRDPADPTTQHGVVGFSEPRPHIIFIHLSNKGEYDRNAIVEKDIRTLSLNDFTVLKKVEIPRELLDPSPLTL